jgi:hypothetical protein
VENVVTNWSRSVCNFHITDTILEPRYGTPEGSTVHIETVRVGLLQRVNDLEYKFAQGRVGCVRDLSYNLLHDLFERR